MEALNELECKGFKLKNNKTNSSFNLPLQERSKHFGQSLVEILVAMSIFTVAIGGLFMATNASKQNLAQSMKIDIEAQYAQLLMNEVNVLDRNVETMYDETTKQSLALPNGNTVYYTRLVDSASTTADIKNISVYFFKGATDTTPYRKFNQEVVMDEQNYNICFANSNVSSADCKATPYTDATGKKWIFQNTCCQNFVSTGGSYRGGLASGAMSTANAVAHAPYPGSLDDNLWKHGGVANTATDDILWKMPASQDVTYTISLGMMEFRNTAAIGCRVMDIYINNVQVEDDFDIFEETGNYAIPITRTYTTTPILDSGLYLNKIEMVAVNPDACGSWLNSNAVLHNISVVRNK